MKLYGAYFRAQVSASESESASARRQPLPVRN